jgi:hypothetical protein
VLPDVSSSRAYSAIALFDAPDCGSTPAATDWAVILGSTVLISTETFTECAAILVSTVLISAEVVLFHSAHLCRECSSL